MKMKPSKGPTHKSHPHKGGTKPSGSGKMIQATDKKFPKKISKY